MALASPAFALALVHKVIKEKTDYCETHKAGGDGDGHNLSFGVAHYRGHETGMVAC